LDPNLAALTKLTTLDGYNLQTRYSQLGFLLTQGLAGAKDLQVQQALVQAAQKSINDQIQASAMISLAYTKDPQFIGIFMSALQNQNITVRFAGLESLAVLGGSQAEAALSNDAQTDSSLIAQAYAAGTIWGMGNITGQSILLNLYQNPSWIVRAIAYHYMGKLGGNYEYTMLLAQLPTETNPIAQAELCAALLRLNKYRNN
ncbi:MAG: HEAT repeat domain-containing protein, partial [Elusimicrobia bacterium]|nr:HEAT repeat domain-containing protein [Elusimicrobiota bacterium]